MGMARARMGAPLIQAQPLSDHRCAKDQPACFLREIHPVSKCGKHSPPHKGPLSIDLARCVRLAGLPTCQDSCFRGERRGEFPDDVRRAVIHEEAEVADGRMENQRDRRGERAQHLVSSSL